MDRLHINDDYTDKCDVHSSPPSCPYRKSGGTWGSHGRCHMLYVVSTVRSRRLTHTLAYEWFGGETVYTPIQNVCVSWSSGTEGVGDRTPGLSVGCIVTPLSQWHCGRKGGIRLLTSINDNWSVSFCGGRDTSFRQGLTGQTLRGLSGRTPPTSREGRVEGTDTVGLPCPDFARVKDY